MAQEACDVARLVEAGDRYAIADVHTAARIGTIQDSPGCADCHINNGRRGAQGVKANMNRRGLALQPENARAL